MTTESIFLDSVKKEFTRYKEVAEKAIDQVPADKLFIKLNEESNSIAIIVQHMAGNMLSRWTDFLASDGEKAWRNRDEEFEVRIRNKEQLMDFWNDGWKCLMKALNSLQNEDLNKTVYIRNEPHTVIDAIQRQLAHYPYHVGQIVFAAKILKEGEWQSLSIPKNKSGEFNEKMFSK
jgi:hypothetical protein